MKEKREKWLSALPVVVTGVLIIFFASFLYGLTFEDIVAFAPKNLWLAGAVILLLYGVKSVSVVFPVTVLYLSVGVIFPLWVAIVLNAVGIFVLVTIPYGLGRKFGTGLVQMLLKKYPKGKRIMEAGISNDIFLSFLLRVVGVMPGDLVSLLFGATGTSYGHYLFGSFMGLIPAMVIQTMMGDAMGEPFSPRFIVLFVLMIVLSLGTSIFFNRVQKKKRG